MAAIGLDFWGMLTVENKPENTGRARQERARLALKKGQKIDEKKVGKLINQLIGFASFELSIFISINDS